MNNGPAPARAAASLLVVRSGAGGPNILMGRRGAGHRFMPHRLVFPGGAVDPEDHAAPVASAVRDAVRKRLERSASPSLANALAVAAARELVEEVGLSLGSPPALATLDYLCRAITPENSPIRFDARFFVVDAACVHGQPAPSDELEDPAWYGLEAALAADLAIPTRAVLLQLRRFLADPPAEDAAVPVLRERKWHWE